MWRRERRCADADACRRTVTDSGGGGRRCREAAAMADSVEKWRQHWTVAGSGSIGGRLATAVGKERAEQRKVAGTGGRWMARAAAVVQPERPWLCGGRAAAVGFHDCRMMTRIQD